MAPDVELLSRLRQAGVTLVAEGDQLRVIAPTGALTPSLREELTGQKQEILKLLKSADAYKKAGVPPILPVKREGQGTAPLSFAQERLWFLYKLEANAAYNIPLGLRLKGLLNISALERSLNEVIRRHEALRTRFETIEGRPVQIVEPFSPLKIPLVDLSFFAQSEREPQALQLCTQDAQCPFDLNQGSPIRIKLFRLDANDHVLLLNMHHIASDGWSVGVLFREIEALYAAFIDGKPSPLPQLPVQFADFTVWQRQWLQGEVLEQQLAYWKKQLHGAPTLLELPTHRSRPAIQSYRGALVRGQLPESLAEALKELSRTEGTTLFMTLLAGFQALLARYTDSEDILVGTPVAGRHRPEIEPLIGFFVNTVVLRGNLSGDCSFRTLLGRTRQTALDAFAHQDVPFEKLVGELNTRRDMAHSPIFQVLFTLQVPEELPALPGLELAPVGIQSGTSKFDLSFILRETAGALHIAVEYCTDLFDASTIQRILGHYQTLLEGIISNPDETLSKLPLLTEAEHRQILVEWNQPQTEHPHDRCVHQLIEEQVQRTPEAVAVVCEGKQLTYYELNARANQLARHLQKLGVGPDVFVGLCMDRSLEMAIGLLGIFKAGGAYVPLAPEYPRERLAFMLEDSGVAVLLTQNHLAGAIQTSKARLIRLDNDWPVIAAESEDKLDPVGTAGNLAYMIYTSGSTGQPKGVLVAHGPLASHCLECRDYYKLIPKDRVLQFASLSFDAATEQILPPLISGARLVLRAANIWSPDEFQQKLLELGLTVINLPPAYWHELTKGWTNSAKLLSAGQLRLLIIGGDVMSIQTLQQWQQLPFNEVRLLNAYGPTETVITATTFEIPAHEPGRETPLKIPIGRRRGSRLIYILDRQGQPVPVGAAGELHIGGHELACGYHRHPELTTEKFIANPFSTDPNARLYKTGDLARYLPDGNIEYLGRLDHQVKIRGFRVELGEIEGALNQHPGVLASVVTAREDTPGDKRLVAYFVSRNGPVSSSELREHVRAKLPDYMVPAAFVPLEALPLSPNGKVDRKALPKPSPVQLETNEDYIASRTHVEQVLSNIWRESLRLEHVGTQDNFFDLGGDSLLVVRVIEQINKTLRVHLNVPTFFQNPTINKLASALDQEIHGKRQPQLFPLHPGSGGDLFLLDVSIGLCRLAQHLENTGLAIHATVVPLNYETFQAAARNEVHKLPSLQELAASHAALIQEQQPSGPCFLAGHSFGGLLAFEVAHQLQQRGRPVKMVFLLDSWANSPPWYKKLKVLTWSRAKESLEFRMRRFWSKAKSKIPRRVKPFVSDDATAPDSDEINRPIGDASWEIWSKIYRKAWKTYLFPPLDCPAVLFRSQQSEAARFYPVYPRLGWDGLFKQGLQLVEVPGDHFTLLKEPQASILAQHLSECLDETRPTKRQNIAETSKGVPALR